MRLDRIGYATLLRDAAEDTLTSEKYVLRIRIELLGVEPPIWRRIEVPESYSFWDLHVAIQDAMGWRDCHLHAFRLIGVETAVGLPCEFDDRIRPGWTVKIREHLHGHSPLALYEYDFGDSWLHEIRFEDIVEAEPESRYPRCVDGARRGPPENSGGPHRYADMVGSLSDPSDVEHDSMREWLGAEFDPEDFDAAQVTFQDPARRRRELLPDAPPRTHGRARD